MTITLEEIKTHQDRLRQDIMERECLLAALDVVARHVAKGRAPSSIDLGLLLPALGSGARTHDLKAIPEPAPEAPALPPPPPPPPAAEQYIHPELKKVGSDYGSDTKLVRWAIEQTTRDYSAHHLAALLKQEGASLGTAKISVVLSRLKARGEIEEIQPGRGPIPALFRCSDIPRPADFKPLDSDLKLPRGCEDGLLRAGASALMMKELLAKVAARSAQARDLSH